MKKRGGLWLGWLKRREEDKGRRKITISDVSGEGWPGCTREDTGRAKETESEGKGVTEVDRLHL